MAILALSIIATPALAQTYYYYYLEVDYEVRQFINPSVVTWDLGVMYADVDGNVFTFGPTDKADYKCWEAETVAITLQNKDTLDDVYSNFRIDVFFDEDGDLATTADQYSGYVDFATASASVSVPAGSGDVFIKITATVLTDIGANQKVADNLRVLELKFTV